LSAPFNLKLFRRERKGVLSLAQSRELKLRVTRGMNGSQHMLLASTNCHPTDEKAYSLSIKE
jgi:hypothetical protein